MYVTYEFGFLVKPRGREIYRSAETYPGWDKAERAAHQFCEALPAEQLPAKVRIVEVAVNAKNGQPAFRRETP